MADVAVLRWEEPPPSRQLSGERQESRWAAVAAELRARVGEWGVVYDGPTTGASSMSTHIRTGAMPAFPAGDFDACSRTPVQGRRVVYARYLGDGDG